MAGQVKADEPMGEVPDNANTNCPGTASDEAGKASACEGCPNQQICATMPKGPDPDLAAISERMSTIRHKVLVLSGKGGVGKSTFSAQLALALAARGKQVGLLDIDICGPSIPRMLALEGEEIHQSAMGWSPVYVDERLGVMSIGFLLPHPDEAVVWRGPRKNGLIKQFLKDVNWGELDYLVVDSPPGTSDEHISLAQYLKASDVDGAVVLTTPQEVSLIDVRKEINFCKKVGIPVLGVVENMSELQMPLDGLRFKSLRGRATTSVETTSLASSVDAGAAVCASNGSREGGKEQDSTTESQLDLTERVFRDLRQACPYLFDGSVVACAELLPRSASGGGEGMARDMVVPFLGRIPLDPTLSRAAEQGRSCLVTATQVDGEVQEGESSVSETPSAIALAQIISKIVATVEGTSAQGQSI